MPREWIDTPKDAGAPLAELHLWPYRSLLRRHFVAFIGITATLVAVPLVSVIGSPVLWGVLPFFVVVLGALWVAIERSYRDGEILEELRLWPDRMTLTRRDRRGNRRDWEANPYWVSVRLHETGGPVDFYITLKGGEREVEIGAFLSEDERKALYDELTSALRRLTDPR
ncbi:MAG: Integral membrane protein [Rhodobacteraceae bacterium HLUCCA08]|nr:MAG: Integral membrane protein [Rhodobacteraceae bacterium HLUCCA08]